MRLEFSIFQLFLQIYFVKLAENFLVEKSLPKILNQFLLPASVFLLERYDFKAINLIYKMTYEIKIDIILVSLKLWNIKMKNDNKN